MASRKVWIPILSMHRHPLIGVRERFSYAERFLVIANNTTKPAEITRMTRVMYCQAGVLWGGLMGRMG